MKMAIVIGSGGSGKSAFSRALGKKLGIPVVHLDQLYWLEGWTKRPADEWLGLLGREIEKEKWIMDGNFGATREMRMSHADTVIFLDLPRYVCLFRILKRTLLYWKRSRPDMADGCREHFDHEFIGWVWNFRRRTRPRLLNEIERTAADKNVIILNSRNSVRDFLQNAVADVN